MIRPYISLDIETTGLSEYCEILQIGAVLDDGVSPIAELEKLNVIIDNKVLRNVESYAAGMNAWIFKEIQKALSGEETSIPVVDFWCAMARLSELIAKCSKLALKFDEDHGIITGSRPNKKIQLAGKNVGSFDMVRINQQCKEKTYMLPKMIQHRCLDIGSVFLRYFGYNPSLDEINVMTGRKSVSHDALDDALDVVHGVRFACAEQKG